MAIKYKTIKRGEPGVKGGGTPKYYAKPVVQGERNLEQLPRSSICSARASRSTDKKHL